MADCDYCMTPPFDYRDFDTSPLGVDMTKGRNGEVTVETCKACGSVWLRYFVEWEWYSESGRWYRGPVTWEMVWQLKPRSEEHTSELQSRQYLVCRLLLEKKKTLELNQAH